MFGIGMPEMLVLLAVALIIFGPKKLPDLAKSLGRALGEFKRATSDLKESIETETGVDEVRHSLNEVKDDIKSHVDLAGTVPDPSDPASSPTSEEPSEEPMDRLKSEYEEMNRDNQEQQAEPPSGKDPVRQETKKS